VHESDKLATDFAERPMPGSRSAPPPLRGFCHACEAEIIPQDLAGGEYQCPTCQESCVECPYESYDRWDGLWDIRYADGTTRQYEIDEMGFVHLLDAEGEPQSTTRLMWAMKDGVGCMRIHAGAGVLEYLRQDEVGNLIVSQHRPDGTVLAGVGLIDGDDGDDEPMTDGQEGNGEDFRVALEQGLEQLAGSWPGMSAQDRDRMRNSMQQFSGELSQMLSQNRPLMEAVQQMQQQARQARSPDGGPPAPALGGMFAMQLGPGGPPLFNIFGPEQWLGPHPWVLPSEARRQQEGVPMQEAVEWLRSRAVLDVKDFEADWQCPICFDSSTEDLVAVCRDSDGKASHVFHCECVADWFVRRDECPSCRRTPVVRESVENPTESRPDVQVSIAQI